MAKFPNPHSEKLKSFNDQLIPMKNVDGLITNVDLHLGNFGAEKEWNDDPQKAHQLFLHTNSYKDFSKPHSLILLGRTGTGKTAILRCLYDHVQKKKSNDYSLAVIVPFNEILDNLIETSSDYLDAATSQHLKDIIARYINCYVMKALIKHYNLTSSVKSKMYAYIKESGLYDIGDTEYMPGCVNKFHEMIKASLAISEGNSKLSFMCTALEMANIFLKHNYQEAYVEMCTYLQNERILVLVDTLNEYDLRDARIVASVKALISTCFDYYNNVNKNHIYVKISLPSEIHTHLVESLPGKQQANAVVIQWRNNDLIKMIALRLLQYCREQHPEKFIFCSNYEYSDFYEGNIAAENAKKFIHEILPEQCPTSLDYYFNTIAYCIRHTLKKPRELIAIFNTFIQYILQTNNTRVFYDNPNKIRDLIHSTQEEMISQALSMYVQSYKDITQACEIVLQNRKYYFLGKELEYKLKEAAVNKIGYGKTEIKRILLESGLIGKINDISYLYNIKDGQTSFNKEIPPTPKNSIQIIKAKFEYQVKGRLSLNREDVYVLHPMCYEHFECIVGCRSMVYPDQFDDDVEIMNSVRLKEQTT